MKKSNKSIIISVLSVLVAMLMVVSLAACGSKDDKKAETKATELATQAETKIVTEAPTEAPTDAPAAETQAPAVTEAKAEADTDNGDAGVEAQSDDELVIPDVTGLWKNENNPNGCTIEVTSQDGNTLDMTITSVRGNAAQIATFSIIVTVTPEMYGNIMRGEDSFEYTDSFGNTGNCIVSVSENVITLVVTEETNAGGNWGISNATGDYIRG